MSQKPCLDGMSFLLVPNETIYQFFLGCSLFLEKTFEVHDIHSDKPLQATDEHLIDLLQGVLHEIATPLTLDIVHSSSKEIFQ